MTGLALASFPAKTIDLGALPTAYVVTVADGFKGADYMCKSPSKVLADAGRGADAFSRTVAFHVNVTDVGRGTDYFGRTVLFYRIFWDAGRLTDYVVRTVYFVKAYSDSFKAGDWMSKGNVVTVRDVVYGEHAPVILPAKELRDSVSVSDWMSKDLVKLFRETVVVRDAPYRVLAIILRDTFLDEGFVTKHPSLAERDSALMQDLATKVAYKLAGKDVRRVYFFPPELQALWDIIMAEDHNVKVEVCKVLIEAFRRVKEKLGE